MTILVALVFGLLVVGALATHGWLLLGVPIGVWVAWRWARRVATRQEPVTGPASGSGAATVADLRRLSPTAFEVAVGRILAGAGYHRVEHVGGPGDLGADLVCYDPAGRLVVVQCKRYGPDHAVGSTELQRFVEVVVIAGASRGLVVTTSQFTAAAEQVAAAHGVMLVDGAGLKRLAATAL